MAAGPVISATTFWERIESVYRLWENSAEASGPFWGSAAGLCLLIGAQSEEEENPKRPNAVSAWLTGYELTDTVISFLPRGHVAIFSSQKKIDLLTPVASADCKPAGYQLTLNVRPLQNAAWKPEIDKALALLVEQVGGRKTGIVQPEWDAEESKFSVEWRQAFADKRLATVDTSVAWAVLLASKQSSELADLKMSASITSGIMAKLVIRTIEKTMQTEGKKTYQDIAELVDNILNTPAKISRKLDPERVESANCTCVRSGSQIGPAMVAGQFTNPAQALTFDTISCSLGVRYASHATVVSRTLFVDPPEGVEARYQLLLKIQQAATAQLKENNAAAEVRKAALEVLRASEYADLEEYFLPNCGFAIGTSTYDSAFVLDEKNTLPLQANMTVHLRVGFTSLGSRIKHPSTREPIAMVLSDSFLIESGASASPLRLTNVPLDWAGVHYTTEDNEEDEDEEIARQWKHRADVEVEGRQLRRRVRDTAAARQGDLDEKYKQEQHKIAQRKLRQLREKYVGKVNSDDENSDEEGSSSSSSSASSSSSSSKDHWDPPKGYSDPSAFPPEAARTQIFVDNQQELVLFPIYGLHVPFHISTIKNVAYDEDNGELRVNFVAPAGGPGGPNRSGATLPPAVRHNPQAIFVRELVFKGGDTRSTQAAFRKIQELAARIKTRENMRRTTEGLRHQESLVLLRTKTIELNDIKIRPNVGSSRVAKGKFAAHKNGFRYSGPRDAVVDILYQNIRYAFFQQAGQTSHCVILHFHLLHPILIGKTKTQDVQVFWEVTEASRELGSHREYDSDGIEEEARERRTRARYNNMFLDFCKQVRQFVPDLGEFEVPYEDLAFNGVPHRSTVLLKPTVHCLVHLADTPFFVLCLEDVEVAFFERVAFGLRNFDLVFVFSDYSRAPIRIDIIPISSLEPIKKWLTECGIMWYESPKNFNWKGVMSMVVGHEKEFWRDGGWRSLQAEEGSDDSSEEESASGEEEYRPYDSDDDEEEEDDDDDDDYSDSDVSSDDDSDVSSEEEEEGLDWEELHHQAAKADRKARPDWSEEGIGKNPKAPAKPPTRSSAPSRPAARSSAPSKPPARSSAPSKPPARAPAKRSR